MFTTIELIIDYCLKQNELELLSPETLKLFGSTKKVIDKTKTGEKVTSLEVF